MKPSRFRTRAAATLALLALLQPTLAREREAPLGLDEIHAAMPPITLVAAGGEPPLDLASLRGRPVLLHFWATWCEPCRREMPLLAALPEQMKDSKLAVLFVDVDAADQKPAVLAFAAGTGVRAPVYMALLSGLGSDFWTWGVPVTYLIDREGRMQGRFLGPRPWDAIPFQRALAAALEGSPR